MLRKSVQSLAAIARNTWLALGAVILLFICLNGLFYVLTYLATGRAGDMDWQMKAEAWRNVPWEREYYKELLAQRSKWAPYVAWWMEPSQGLYLNHDERGLRRTWNPAHQTGAPPVRVFMFGGSTLEGFGARDDFTIPSILAKLLTNANLHVQVTNFGQGGYVSTQEAIALLLELRRGNTPDIVIFYDGANELYSAVQNGAAGLPENEVNRIKEFNILSKTRRLDLVRETLSSVVRQSSIGRVLKFLRKHSPSRPPENRDQLARDVVSTYRFDTQWVEDLARWKNFQVAFYWQPMLFTKKFRSPFEQKLYDAEESVKGYRQFCLQVDADLERDKKLGHDPHFHNICHLLDNSRSPVFIDSMHVNEEANEIIARRMFIDVRKMVRDASLRSAAKRNVITK